MKSNRIFSMMLSLMLLLGMMPGLSPAAYADDGTTWSENRIFNDDVSFNNGVRISNDITVTIAAGRKVSVNGGIDAENKTLTVNGHGMLIVNGSNAYDSSGDADDGSTGFAGNIVVEGASIIVTGGRGGDGGDNNYGGHGGDGGRGVSGDVTVNSGSVNVTGGNGGNGGNGKSWSNGGNGGEGGMGVSGEVTVNGGSLSVTGGNGGNGGNAESGGYGGQGGDGMFDTVTVNGGSIIVSGGDGGSAGSGKDSTEDGVDGIGGFGIYDDIILNGGIAAVTGGNDRQAITGKIGGPYTEIRESDDGENWSLVSGTSSEKKYVKAEAKYPLWIGGTQVTIANRNNVLGDGKVSFTPASGSVPATLTLKGVDLNGDSDGWTDDGGSGYSTIRTELKDLTIMVETDSTVTGPSSGEKTYSYGILSNDNLTIRGRGTLNVSGGNHGYNFGISADNIIIDGKLSANGVMPTVHTDADNSGVYVHTGITINEGAELTATGVGSNGMAIVDADDAKLVNAVDGTGWTDTAGTKEKTEIVKGNHKLEELQNYKKVQFPGVPEPAKKYTVTFTDGQGNTLDVQSVEEGKAATAPADPAREGYSFNGWDTDFSKVRSDLTVTAKWKQIIVTHKVTFEDGMGKVLDTQDVVDGRPATAPAAPTRAGYIFAGWDTDFSSVTTDLTVKARWEKESAKTDSYKVVFVLGFGYDPVSVEVGKGGSAAAPAVPKVDGFTFIGWDKEFSNVTENMTVTAKWEKDTLGKVHTVVFVDGYNVVPIRIQRVKDGTAAVPPADPVREGYTFDGWDTDFSYVTSDLTVIAQWTQNAATVKTITVNSKTVSASVLDAAVKKAGCRRNTITTITLGKKVKKISKGAFKNYRNAKTLIVKTKKLTKKSVKGSLKGSKVRTVKIKVGKKKTNKKYVKKYKKIFTKKNAGRKVRVR